MNLGMTKEVSNLIKENNELLETKYVTDDYMNNRMFYLSLLEMH